MDTFGVAGRRQLVLAPVVPLEPVPAVERIGAVREEALDPFVRRGQYTNSFSIRAGRYSGSAAGGGSAARAIRSWRRDLSQCRVDCGGGAPPLSWSHGAISIIY
jgi:hypothetical protein